MKFSFYFILFYCLFSYHANPTNVFFTFNVIPLSQENVRSSEKFLSFYKEVMDAQHFSFYIMLSNYVRSIFLYQDKDRNVWQIRFHVCIKMHRCKRRVRKRKTLFGQPNIRDVYAAQLRNNRRTTLCCWFNFDQNALYTLIRASHKQLTKLTKSRVDQFDFRQART